MQKKILYCASIDNHFKAFHLPYMKWFQKKGWQVHVASKGGAFLPFCDVKYNVSIERSPFNIHNLKAYREIKKIIDENAFDIIHVHTPMAGVIVRLAARASRKRGTKVLYTAHGFHFFKGAPKLNWMIYYPLERWLSHYTDYLITINKEDYNLALNHGFKAGSINYVHGVGVDTSRFKPVIHKKKLELREACGYKEEDFLIYYVAELNKNKNQGMLLKALAYTRNKIPNVRLLLAGEGKLMLRYKEMARELGVEDIVDFLGFREDADIIGKISDVAVGSSYREGLPVNIMEGMACGKPIVATDNRGHRELVINNYNGFLVPCNHEIELGESLYELYQFADLRKKFGENSINKISEFTLSKVKNEMEIIYNEAMKSRGDMDGVSNKSITCSS